MIPQQQLKFLTALKKNNNKAWFDAHRNDYDTAKLSFTSFVAVLIGKMMSFDPALSGLQAKDCLFRINRDVRFSKEKHPYKTNMAAYFNKDGKKGMGAGYYLHIEPGKSFLAAGIWMPPANELAAIRQEIDYNFAELKKLVSSAAFKKNFPKGLQSEAKLSRPPKGYTDDNPAIDWLKMKGFIVSRSFSDKELGDAKFGTVVASSFKTAKPLVDFINRALD